MGLMRSLRSVSVFFRKTVYFVIFLTVAFLLCGSAFSQVNLGRIIGAVTDQSGGAIVGATVSVVDVQRGITRPLTTDSAGEYSAPSLTPGTYTVRAEAKGFRTVERTDITVGVGQDVRVDLTLTPGEQTQTITVSGEAPEINTTNAELGGTLESQPLNDLPVNGRSYTKLVTYRPGVIVAPGGYSYTFHSNGNRQESQVWLFDGLDDSSPWAAGGPTVGGAALQGDEATVLPLDSIQEVNIVENPKAEYGWKPGAQVNVGLKSGTNGIHGSAYAFGRDQALDARNPYLSPTLGKAQDNLEQFGASIGGPIKKDKIFYFGNYEGQRFSVGNPKTVQDPSSVAGSGAANSLPDAIAAMNAAHEPLSQLSLNLAGCTSAGVCNPTAGVFNNASAAATVPLALNNNGRSDAAIEKIDYHLNDHNTINGEYYFGQGNQDAVSNSLHQYWAQFNEYRSQVVRAVWVTTPNSTWVNEARFGYDRGNLPSGPAECTQNLGQPSYASFGFVSGAPTAPPECGFPTLTVTGFQQLGQAASTEILSGTWGASDVVSYTRGKHLFKFGAEWHDSRFFGPGKVTNLTGNLTFGSVSAFTNATALEDFLAGVPASGTIFLGNANRQFRQQRYAFFAQDDFRLTSHLTLNMGLRFELQPPITDANNELGNFDPNTPSGLIQETSGSPVYDTYWHFSPRLGIAWDVTGKGTTVVQAGGNIMPTTLPLNNLVQSPNGAQINAIPTGFKLVAANGSIVPSPGNIQVGNVSLTNAQLQPNWQLNTPIFNSTPTALVCGNGVSPNPSPCAISPINPDLKGSYVSAWTLAVQHAFTSNLSLNVAYVGTHGTKLGGVVDINQPTLGQKNGSGAASTLEQLRRPYYNEFPWLGQIRYYTDLMKSNYDGLQTTLTERLSHGLSFTAGYTLAHYLDESLNESNFQVEDNAQPNFEYGDSTLDARHNFTLTGTYMVPGRKSPLQLLEGWEVNTAVDLLSAFPFNAEDTTSDISGTGELFDRWTLVGPASAFSGEGITTPYPCWGVAGSSFASAKNCTKVTAGASGTLTQTNAAAMVSNMPAACVSAAAAETTNAAVIAANDKNATGLMALANFGCYMEGKSVIVPPAQGTYGTMGRDVIRAVPFTGWDFSATKNWKLKENINAQFRLEVFNILNKTAYAAPSGNPNVPTTFGQSQSTPNTGNVIIGSGGPREMQLGLKFTF